MQLVFYGKNQQYVGIYRYKNYLNKFKVIVVVFQLQYIKNV